MRCMFRDSVGAAMVHACLVRSSPATKQVRVDRYSTIIFRFSLKTLTPSRRLLAEAAPFVRYRGPVRRACVLVNTHQLLSLR